MAIYNWSDLNDGDVFGVDHDPFDPEADQLIFDDAGIAAARVFFDGDETGTFLTVDGKTVTLDCSPLTITTANVTFSDGSVLIVGDDTTGVLDDDAANIITGGAGDDLLIGLGGADSISGGDGNDYFPIYGDDTGSYGNDTIDGGNDNDTIDFSDADFALDIDLAGGMATGGDGDPGSTLTLVSIENVTGGSGNDSITGNGDANYINGEGGQDVINGGGGNDTLDGLFAADTLSGGEGNDYYIVDVVDGMLVEDTIVEAADEGIDTIELVRNTFDSGPFSYTLGANIENLLLYDGIGTPDETIENWNGTGNELDNLIVGNGGNNVLDGGDGNDSLVGAGGSDTFLGSEGRDIALGGAGNDVFNGTSTEVNGLRTDARQAFEGGAGNDTINGAADAGLITIAEYRNATDGVTVSLGGAFGPVGPMGTASDGEGGTDTLIRVDGVVGSMHDDVLYGGGFENTIGRNGQQFFEGLAGDDTITGGFDFGNAEVLYESSLHGVIVNLSGVDVVVGDVTVQGGTAIDGWGDADGTGGTDRLAQIDRVRGSAHNDTLIGGSEDEEHFEGLGGDDWIDGGNEFDNVHYNHADEAVYVNLALGIGRGLADSVAGGSVGIDTLASIEAVHGSDFADVLIGGLGAQLSEFEDLEEWEIQLYPGFEEFGGRAGDDTLDGGDEDPATFDVATYRESPNAIIFNLGGDDVDGVGTNQARDGYDVNGNLAGVDTLIGINGVDGSRFNDTMVGSDGDEYFLGGQGNDSIVGGGGNDYISFDSGFSVHIDLADGVAYEQFGSGFGAAFFTDTFTGIENVLGSFVNDTIVGDDGANLLAGFEGNDWIDGGDVNDVSNDSLHGGEGNDTLVAGFGADHLDGGFDTDDQIVFYDLDGLSSTGVVYGDAVGVHVDLGAGTFDTDRSVGDNPTGTLINVEIVYGSAGNDLLVGGGANRAGNDVFREILRGGEGNDTFDGAGSGQDGYGYLDRVDFGTLDGSTPPNGVIINLGTTVFSGVAGGTARDAWGDTDTLLNINWVSGTGKNDSLVGSNNLAADDEFERFQGNRGNDFIDGRGGIDEAAYMGATGSVNVNLATGIATGADGTDTLLNIERVRGSRFNDIITGSNNTAVVELFIGDEGNDTINGGAGIDYASWQPTSLDGGGLVAFIQNGSGTVTHVETGTDTLINIEGLVGTNSNDSLAGGLGDQWFRGRGGSDTLNGGLGIDWADYSVDRGAVIVNLGTGTATDGWGGDWELEGTDKLIAIENVLGSNFNDRITGSTLANLLEGGVGNDTLDGGVGNDTLDGGAGNDSLLGSAGEDTFTDRTGNDTLNGGTEDDTFLVNYGAGSTVTAIGGAGGDTYVLNPDAIGYTYRVTDFALTGTSKDFIDVGALLDKAALAGYYSGQDPFAAGFLKFLKVGADKVLQWDLDGTGTAFGFVNVLTLVGKGAAAITAASLKGLVVGSVSPDSLVGSGDDDVLLGLGGNDTLSGGGGDDLLFGGVGVDTMTGGTGNDTYQVDNVGDKVIEANNNPAALVAPGGFGPGSAGVGSITDTVIAAINFALNETTLKFVENIQLTATASRATGNALANVLTGNAGNDTLEGAAGNDTMDGGVGNDSMVGGAGNDLFLVDVAGDVTTEAAAGGTDTVQSSVTRVLAVNLENLLLTGTGIINGTGNTLANLLTGNSNKNVLTGDAGNDTLDGGAGNDTMIGGAGNDTYVSDSATDVVTEAAAGGTDTLMSSVTKVLAANVENLTLIGSQSINGTGNTVANKLTGNGGDNVLDGGAGNDILDGGGGNDTLTGGAGADTLTGGAGDDLYVVDATTEVVTEAANGGIDTVQSAAAFTLSVNVENLVLTGAGVINGTGNTLNNAMTGNTGDNILDSGGGDDTLVGGDGADTLVGGIGHDTLTGGEGNDSLDGGEGDDTLSGGNGTDTLVGGAGHDLLIWSMGDYFHGGDDGDVLRFGGAGATINLTTLPNDRISSVEVFDITGSGNNTLVLSMDEVLAMSATTMSLQVDGNAGDTVVRGADWTTQDDAQFGAQTYHVYTQGDAILLVNAAMTSLVDPV